MRLPDDLPAGRLVTPKVWVADGPVPDATARWVDAQLTHADTGWWPVLLPPDLDVAVFGAERTDDVDAERFLAERWASDEIAFFADPAEVDDPDQLLPYPTWPGLAPGSTGAGPDPMAASFVTSPWTHAGYISDAFAHLDAHPDTRVPNPLLADGGVGLGLVASADSARVIAAAGWEHELGGGPEATAVLRSWQERFGVRLVALGEDWLAVTASWPVPADDRDHARRLAAEHVAFCPDILGETTFEEYAANLEASVLWRFWWD